MAIMLALLAASAVRTGIRFSEMILQLSLWTKITLITIICGLSLYFNDLYDFQVVRRRDNLFVHTMQALGAACFLLALLFYISPATSLGRGIALLAGPLILALLLSWRLSANKKLRIWPDNFPITSGLPVYQGLSEGMRRNTCREPSWAIIARLIFPRFSSR